MARRKKRWLRDIFDAAKGEEEKLKGIAGAIKGSPVWIGKAILASYHIPFEKEYLTTDDFWRACLQDKVPYPREPRAMAGVTGAFRSDGMIEPTEEWRQSDRVACHRRRLTVWRSLVYKRSSKRHRPL